MKRLVATSLAAFSLGLAAEAVQAQEPIRIGASLPLTGNFSVAGERHREGYELCVERINEKGGVDGRQIELIVSDNRSDTETAMSQHERLINLQEVDLIFGTFSSKLTFPVSAVANQYGYVYPVPSGGALRIWTRGFDNMFYFQHNPPEFTGETLTNAIQELIPEDQRPKTVAVVHADDFFANGIVAGLVGDKVMDPGGGVVADLSPGYFADIGMEVVFQDKWPEEGFSDWLNLANSIKQSGAEMVAGMTASEEEAVQLTRALQTVRAPVKLLYLSQGTQAEYGQDTGSASQGVIIHSAWHPKANWEGRLAGEAFTNEEFVNAYQEKYGSQPVEDVAITFAVCQAMEQAIRGAGGPDNAKIKDWMHSRTEEDPVRTILGAFHWDERGLPIGKDFLLVQWQDGELRFVYPTDEFPGVVDLIHPKPEW